LGIPNSYILVLQPQAPDTQTRKLCAERREMNPGCFGNILKELGKIHHARIRICNIYFSNLVVGGTVNFFYGLMVSLNEFLFGWNGSYG